MGIAIGKRYRLEIRPNPEYSCPGCGLNRGEYILDHYPELQGQQVRVEETSNEILCECDYISPRLEGIYNAVFLSGDWENATLSIPYTWLIPLQEGKE